MNAALLALIVALLATLALAVPVDFNTCGGLLKVEKIEGMFHLWSFFHLVMVLIPLFHSFSPFSLHSDWLSINQSPQNRTGSNWPPAKGQHFSSVTTLSNQSGSPAKFDGSWTVQTKWNGMSADSKAGTVCNDGFGDLTCGQTIAAGASLAVTNEGDFPTSAPAGTYIVRTEVKDSQSNVLYCYTTTFKV